MKNIKFHSIDRTEYEVFLERARLFRRAMKILEKTEKHGSALLGIHASISLADAITVFNIGKKSISDSHAYTVELLESVCLNKRIRDAQG